MAENNNTLLEKLDGLVARFEEVSTLITDPNVIADQKRYVKLTKEYKDLNDIMKARREYIQCLNGLEEAKQIMTNESDPEMKEMAREEANLCEVRIPELEEEIKLLLVPADPQDDRNAILEIRGGTGGDEAAIFAGDLFRMYSKYCETKGWRLEVSSAIVCNVYQPPKPKDVYILQPHQSPFYPKPSLLMWKLTKGKSNGTLSEAVVPADRT